MTDLPIPIDYAPPASASPCMSDANHRRAGWAFAGLGLLVAGFAAFWGRQLEWNHVLAAHGCKCGLLSVENLVAFGGLPLVGGLCVYGARRAAVQAAVAVAGVGSGLTCLAYADLWATYFGLLRPHLFF